MTSPSGLFDPRPPALTPRQQLLAQEAALLKEYSSAGGDRRGEIDRALIDIRARLALMPRPAPPAAASRAPPSPARAQRDGRLAATGERSGDDDE